MTAVVKEFAIVNWDNADAFMDFLVNINFSLFHAFTVDYKQQSDKNCGLASYMVIMIYIALFYTAPDS